MATTLKVGTLGVELKLMAEGFRKGLKASEDSLKNLGSAAKTMGKGLAAAGGAAVVGLGLVAKAAADLEQSVMQAAAVTKGGVKNFQEFKQAAIAASQGSAFSAREAGDALRYLSMAGLSTEQATKALPTTLSLATAGMIDLGRAADISSDIMTAFRMSAEDLAHVNDVLVGTTTQSNTNLEMLADSMKYVGPTAAAMGQSIETVSAAIGLLGNAGIKGSQAGTTLRMAMLRLVKPPKLAKEALDNLGVQVVDSEGKMLDMVSIIAQLEKAQVAYGSNTAAFAADLARLFGVEAVSGIQAMVSQGSEAFARFRDDLTETEGTAKRVEDAMLSTFSSQFNILKGNIENVAATIGDQLLPYMKALNELFVAGALGAQQQATSTNSLAQSMAQLAGAFASMLKVMGVVAKIGTVFYAILRALVTAGRMVGYAIMIAVDAIGLLGAAAARNQDAVESLTLSMSDTFGLLHAEIDQSKTDMANMWGVADGLSKAGDAVAGVLEKVAQTSTDASAGIEKAGDAAKYTTAQYQKMMEAYNIYQGGLLGVENERITAYLEQNKAKEPEMGPVDRTAGFGGKAKGPSPDKKRGRESGKSDAQRAAEDIARRNAEARRELELLMATEQERNALALARSEYDRLELNRQIKMKEIAAAALTSDEQALAYARATSDYLNGMAKLRQDEADAAAKTREEQEKAAEAAKELLAYTRERAKAELRISRRAAEDQVASDVGFGAIRAMGGGGFITDMLEQGAADMMASMDPITMAFKAGGAWAQGIISWFMEQKRLQQHLKVLSQGLMEAGFGMPDLMDSFLKAWEPAIGAILTVVQALKPIGDLLGGGGIMQRVTSQVFAGMKFFLTGLLKFAEGLAYVSEGIAYVVYKILDLATYITNKINSALSKIGMSINFSGVEAARDAAKQSYEDIGTTLDAVQAAQDALANATIESSQAIYDETKKRAELTEALKEGIRNAPSGFKVARYRYGAEAPMGAGAMGMLAGGTGGIQVGGNLVIVAHDYEDFVQQMETKAFRESGTRKTEKRIPKRQRG